MEPKSSEGKEKQVIILKKLPKEKIAQLKNFQVQMNSQLSGITKPKSQIEQMKGIKTTLNVMGINKNMVLKPVTDMQQFKNIQNILKNQDLLKFKPNQKFKIIGNVNKSPEKVKSQETDGGIVVKQENGNVVANSDAVTSTYFKQTNVLAKPTYHCSKCKYASTSELEIKEHIKKHLPGTTKSHLSKTPEKVYTTFAKNIKKPIVVKSKMQGVKSVPEKVSSVSSANLNYALKHEKKNNDYEQEEMEVDDAIMEPHVIHTEPIVIQGKRVPINKGLSRHNDIICAKCGFMAKHPLVFKIHMSEKHGDSKEKKQKIKDDKLQKLNDENNWEDFDDFFATPISTPPNKVLASPKKNSEQSHLCFQCGFEAQFAEQLQQHEEKEHGKESVTEFKCEYCDWTSRNPDKILFHLIHHPDQEVDPKIDTSILVKHGIIKV